MRLRAFALAATLFAQDAVPVELLENIELFLEIDVAEAAAEEELFEAAVSTAAPAGLEETEAAELEKPATGQASPPATEETSP